MSIRGAHATVWVGNDELGAALAAADG